MILAVDPGVNGCGWALFKNKELFSAGFTPADHPAKCPATWSKMAIKLLDDALTQNPADLLVVELMRVYAQGQSDPADIVNLQGLSGALVGAFAVKNPGAETVGFLARDWKGQVPREIFGNRIGVLIDRQGWRPRVRAPRRKSQLNDVHHAVGLALHALARADTPGRGKTAPLPPATQ